MPAYNAATTIPVAIESLLNQTWTNIELIVVDDGSKDDTWRVVQSFAARDPRVVALRHNQNRGAYAARNTALKSASGDFVTVNDADDWSHPERLAVQVLGLLDAGHKLNTTRCVRVDSGLDGASRCRRRDFHTELQLVDYEEASRRCAWWVG